jgi:hypothetical protein
VLCCQGATYASSCEDIGDRLNRAYRSVCIHSAAAVYSSINCVEFQGDVTIECMKSKTGQHNDGQQEQHDITDNEGHG